MPAFDYYELAKKLKLERLFVSNERKEIEALNRKVHSTISALLQSAWMSGMQRLENHATPANLNFVDAHRHFNHKQLQSWMELVNLLRGAPEVVGTMLAAFEAEVEFPRVEEVIKGVVNLYGGLSSPLLDDPAPTLTLLSTLSLLTLPSSPAPRRALLRHSSFSHLYRLFAESLPSSRLFLVGALNAPLSQLLCFGEEIIINSDVAAIERTERMGRIVKAFVESIVEHVGSFPGDLCYLIKTIHAQLTPHHPPKTVAGVCTDLVWALFICPAVTNPEPFGVTDAPIGPTARAQLSQVSTILQALALYRWEGTDPRLAEYVSYLDTDSLPSLLDTILSLPPPPPPPPLSRRSILLPAAQLPILHAFLRDSLVILERTGRLTDIESWPNLVKASGSVEAAGAGAGNVSTAAASTSNTVVVFPVGTESGSEWVGLLSEADVIGKKLPELVEDLEDCKRTRFDDQASVGTTSDNLEAVSEAASTHSANSASSSIDGDAEAEADRLSDMLSANVSGRGTPNVSGRNTPTGDEDVAMDEANGDGVVAPTPAAAAKAAKQQRSEIEDKFCKFEIKKAFTGGGVDETVSLVSDTWSTDVLASESEFGDRLPLPAAPQGTDTMSEAWSTDVGGATEIERLHDFDAEEGRSDAVDTPRSSVSGGGGSRNPVDLLLFDEPEASGATAGVVAMEIEKDPAGVGLGPVTPTPSRSSGRSITFDKSAEKADDADPRRRNFFRNFRLPFRGSPRRMADPSPRGANSVGAMSMGMGSGGAVGGAGALFDPSEDILAKYARRKASSESCGELASAAREMRLAPVSVGASASSSAGGVTIKKEKGRSELVQEARRKLRAVLSCCDLAGVRRPPEQGPAPIDMAHALVSILQSEMAAAISRADPGFAAQVQEAIRTVKQLGTEGCRKTLRLLKDDYRRRCDYISYLIRAKQGLLAALQYIERAAARTRVESATYARFLMSERVRLRLEVALQGSGFEDEVKNAVGADEKAAVLARWRERVVGELRVELGDQIEDAVEQQLAGRIYNHVMHPNGEVDVHRDTLLHDHIARLDPTITPQHKDLRIPKHQLGECPWPAAQRELRMLAAYRTAADKLKCVVRACGLIVNLLGAGGGGAGAVAADDFVPVLVYVVIKTNPPSLLSTIQYVSSFCRVTGEAEYWWTQFCSAVEFIKMMDYNNHQGQQGQVVVVVGE